MNPLMNPADYHESCRFSWKVPHFIWKVVLFMKSATFHMKSGAFHEKCHISWKAHFSYEKQCFSWNVALFKVKCSAFHEKCRISLWAFRLSPSIGLSFERPTRSWAYETLLEWYITGLLNCAWSQILQNFLTGKLRPIHKAFSNTKFPQNVINLNLAKMSKLLIQKDFSN